jgi:hypothetical protein
MVPPLGKSPIDSRSVATPCARISTEPQPNSGYIRASSLRCGWHARACQRLSSGLPVWLARAAFWMASRTSRAG